MIFEKPTFPIPKCKEILSLIQKVNVTTAIIAFLNGVTGPIAILLGVAMTSGLSNEQVFSWVFAGYFFGGILTVILSVLYRQPIAVVWNLSGTVLVAGAIEHLSFEEIIGSYLVSGAIILALGLTGWIKKIMDMIPLPIVMSMIAGIFLPLGLNIVYAFEEVGWIAFATAVGFVIFTLHSRLNAICPPILGAVLFGIIMGILRDAYTLEIPLSVSFVQPIVYVPHFSVQSLVELVIPLVITVIGIHNTQGNGVLKAFSYQPPSNVLTVSSGIGSLAMGMFGGISACIGGPACAILNSYGVKEYRYISAVLFGIFFVFFGIFSPVTTTLAMALPNAVIGMFGGLAMIYVLQGAFTEAFRGSFSFGSLVTFLITLSNVTIFGIGSAFWGLLFGFISSWLFEKKDFEDKLLKNVHENVHV